jgi:hypothetical protein
VHLIFWSAIWHTVPAFLHVLTISMLREMRFAGGLSCIDGLTGVLASCPVEGEVAECCPSKRRMIEIFRSQRQLFGAVTIFLFGGNAEQA